MAFKYALTESEPSRTSSGRHKHNNTNTCNIRINDANNTFFRRGDLDNSDVNNNYSRDDCNNHHNNNHNHNAGHNDHKSTGKDAASSLHSHACGTHKQSLN